MWQEPTWRYTGIDLALQIGDRVLPVPAALSQWLLGPSGIDLSADAAADLLAAEQQLRRRASADQSRVDGATQRVALARAAYSATNPQWTLRTKRQRRAARAALVAAAEEHTAATAALQHTRTLLAELRTFVIVAQVPTGLLAEAARSWRRCPDPAADARAHLRRPRRPGWAGGAGPDRHHVVSSGRGGREGQVEER